MLKTLFKMLLNKLFQPISGRSHRTTLRSSSKKSIFKCANDPCNLQFWLKISALFSPFQCLEFFLSSLPLANDVHVHHLRWQPLHFNSQHHRHPPGPATWPRAAWGLPGAGPIRSAVGGHATQGDEAGEAHAARAGGDPTPPQKKRSSWKGCKTPNRFVADDFFEFSY